MSDILLVCHANECRSPMAEALLQRLLARGGLRASVVSAGLTGGGQPVAFGAVRALRRHGLQLSNHRSHLVTSAMVKEAALVIGFERRHVRELVLMVPDAWPRTFTLKELVRRGESIGNRLPGESAESWIDRVRAGRRRDEHAGTDSQDDVADPMGASAADFEHTAAELDALLTRLAELFAGRVARSSISALRQRTRTTAASP